MLNAGALPAAGCDLNKILLSTTKFDMTDERLICLFSSAPAQARAPAPAPALAPAAAPARRHRNPHPLADSPAQKHPTFHDHLLRTSHGHQSANEEMWVHLCPLRVSRTLFPLLRIAGIGARVGLLSLPPPRQFVCSVSISASRKPVLVYKGLRREFVCKAERAERSLMHPALFCSFVSTLWHLIRVWPRNHTHNHVATPAPIWGRVSSRSSQATGGRL